MLGSPLLVDRRPQFFQELKTLLNSTAVMILWLKRTQPLHYTRTITYTISLDLSRMVEFPPRRKLRRMHSYCRRRSQTTHVSLPFSDTWTTYWSALPLLWNSVRKSAAGARRCHNKAVQQLVWRLKRYVCDVSVWGQPKPQALTLDINFMGEIFFSVWFHNVKSALGQN